MDVEPRTGAANVVLVNLELVGLVLLPGNLHYLLARARDMRQAFLVEFIVDRHRHIPGKGMAHEVCVTCIPVCLWPDEVVAVVLVLIIELTDSSPPASHKTHLRILF